MHKLHHERRNFHRVQFHSPVQLSCGDHTLTATMLDLSLHGALLQLPADAQGLSIPTNTPCSVHIHLTEQAIIHFQALTIRQDNATLALETANMDLDSIQHLKRLVELNLGAPELLERDMKALLAHHRENHGETLPEA